MAARFFGDDGEAALRQAIEAVEQASAAEVVVSVRPRSGSYLHADLGAGVIVGVATLAFVLGSPWPFAVTWLFLDPVLAGVVAAVATAHLPPLRRLLSRRESRRLAVVQAARATFVDRGVHRTRDRSGVLIYVSLLERCAVVVADVGVVDAAPAPAWRRAVAAIEEVGRRGGDAVALAGAIRGLTGALADALPRRADDVDELPNEVLR